MRTSKSFAAAIALSAALFSVSCSSAPSTGSSSPSVGDPNYLTIEQIRATDARDALEAVERLRPLWLRIRGQSSINGTNTILVYLNETRLGGIDVLRGYPLEAITSIKYLSASEAANKLMGTSTTVVEGAIVLSTRK
jgi:hypothetical protein